MALFAREIHANRSSKCFKSTRCPACSISAVACSAVEGKEERQQKKGSPYASVGGGKHALSAVVLHPVKACVALCIITSTYIINSLPPSLISIIIKLLLCLVYNNTAPTIVLAAPSFFRSSSSSIIVLLYYYVVEIFFPILCCCLLFSSAFFFVCCCVCLFFWDDTYTSDHFASRLSTPSRYDL